MQNVYDRIAYYKEFFSHISEIQMWTKAFIAFRIHYIKGYRRLATIETIEPGNPPLLHSLLPLIIRK